MTIIELIDTIRQDKNCIVYQPNLTIELSCYLPDDLKTFYELTDGIAFFQAEPYGINIVGRTRFERANPVIIRENGEGDISYNWFIIAYALDLSQYITIDLAIDRLGKCYDSFWETYGLVDNMPVIANSFTDLLARLYDNHGQNWYWLQPDFERLGDAYDNQNI